MVDGWAVSFSAIQGMQRLCRSVNNTVARHFYCCEKITMLASCWLPHPEVCAACQERHIPFCKTRSAKQRR